MSKVKVCHLTNVHSPLDQRIFYKETLSLVAAGYEVSVIGPAPRTLEGEKDGVRILTIPKRPGLAGRLRTTLSLLRRGWSLRADIYHFHDPELLAVGVLLRVAGCKVIYDCHEHYPEVVYARSWVPHRLRRLLSVVIDCFERLMARSLSGVLGVVDEQEKRFRHRPFAAVKNFPRLEWFSPNGYGDQAECELLHIGSLCADRGSDFLVEIMCELRHTHPLARLRTLGAFHTRADEASFRSQLERHGLADRVVCDVDRVAYDSLGEIIQRHRVGLIPGQVSVKNLTPFIPTKLFEYLACGIPVVASDLPSIRSFYRASDWGAIADPADPVAHARAIAELLDDPEQAARKGHRGRALVESSCNWSAEAQKLLLFYERIANGNGTHSTLEEGSPHVSH